VPAADYLFLLTALASEKNHPPNEPDPLASGNTRPML
jgi:hypothetical protein